VSVPLLPSQRPSISDWIILRLRVARNWRPTLDSPRQVANADARRVSASVVGQVSGTHQSAKVIRAVSAGARSLGEGQERLVMIGRGKFEVREQVIDECRGVDLRAELRVIVAPFLPGGSEFVERHGTWLR